MESLNVLHSRGEIISKEVGCIDRVIDKMAIKVTCVREKYKSKVIHTDLLYYYNSQRLIILFPCRESLAQYLD